MVSMDYSGIDGQRSEKIKSRRQFLLGTGLIVAGSMCKSLYSQQPRGDGTSTEVDVDLGRDTGSLRHYWEKTASSDRTVVGLRDQWRQDMIRVRREMGMQSVRCHGLFDDEMGIAAAGSGEFNFLYVDQIYDFMLENGVRPFVELSFMPEAFASSANRIFAYKGNTSPPNNWQDWRDMVQAFTQHCVKRYGISEVSSWKYEVWNEPNIAFWAGTQEQYFELYRQSAMAVKAVHRSLQVGGPATAQLAWVPDLIRYCANHNVPIDFVSSHIYPQDPQKYIFGKDNLYPFEQVIPQGVKLIKNQVESSVMPDLPLLITECSSQNPAFIVDTIKNCIGLAETMAYWTFSNVFEEGGVPEGLFNKQFGLLDQWGIARPSLHAFAFLHKLGDAQLHAGDGPVIATRRGDGSLALMVWNLIPATDANALANGDPQNAGGGTEDGSTGGAGMNLTLRLSGLAGRKHARICSVGGSVGSALPVWHAMGSPRSPTHDQISQLRLAAELPKPEIRALSSSEPSRFTISLPPNGVALIEFL